MESTAFNIITFKTHPNPDQPPDHPLPSLPCTFLPTSGCSAPQCGPFSSWDFSRDLADVKPCISTKCSSVFADSVCWPSWRSGWDSFEWRVAKRRKTKWLTSNYSWKDDQAPLRKCSPAFLHAQMAVLPDSSQGLGCSEPLRKLFLVNQNGCPKNKLSHDNFESCSQTLQIKAVWEMVQISMQTWGCLSETNLQNLASSEKNEQCWVGSLHAAWWKARQPCRWCLTCSRWAAHLHPDRVGTACSWTSRDGSMVVDMAGGCGRALPAQLCLQIEACGRDLGRVQRSAGGGRLGAAVDCCVSTSERRNPADFQGKKRLTGAFFFSFLEIQPWPVAPRITVSMMGFVCHWGNQEGWRG